ncbi:MCE family protein [Rhodococcus jostii]|uniref:Virulence factor Mce family protein n=1 Tax=Rhodococcus jostii TaxID=132919 RepID=A0A1H5BS63_RHOJO|nr:MCE family protein [Rhodococcus jostii]SED57226.1 virulence factor Mce family protein [Rhodococcus jostii]
MTGRTGFATIGALASLTLTAGYVSLFAWGSRTFDSTPQITATVPAEAGALRLDSSVLYRGVHVGRVDAIDAGAAASEVTLGIDEDALTRIPADVRVRLIPRTVFGDYFVDLIPPPGRDDAASLTPGDTVLPDQSLTSVQLYQAFSRIYDLVRAVNPADLNITLGAVATALDGKGADLGASLESLQAAMSGSQPLLDGLGDDLDDIATLSRQLDATAPDVLTTLGNSITSSRTIVDEQQGLATLLEAGTRTAGDAAVLIGDNRDRLITLVDDTDPVLASLTSRPGQITTVYSGLQNLVTTLPPAVANGPWLSADLNLSVKDLYPYHTFGGTAGPVGSDSEKAQIFQLFGTAGDLEAMMAGPILRGTTVVR